MIFVYINLIDLNKYLKYIHMNRITRVLIKPNTFNIFKYQVDTTEFEKSGGSVRCMTLDVFTN